MAINLEDEFVTIEIINNETEQVLYSQEVPKGLITRFLITFDFTYGKEVKQGFRILDKNKELITKL
jgi:hypothetical protein